MCVVLSGGGTYALIGFLILIVLCGALNHITTNVVEITENQIKTVVFNTTKYADSAEIAKYADIVDVGTFWQGLLVDKTILLILVVLTVVGIFIIATRG